MTWSSGSSNSGYARNQIGVDDLKLDSAVAVRLTLEVAGGCQKYDAIGPGPAD